MEKIDFKNKPDTSTPINANNLNLLQDNIEKTINGIIETGDGYIKFSNGILICIGSFFVDQTALEWSDYYQFCDMASDIKVSFPQTFIDNSYKITFASNVFGVLGAIIQNKEKTNFQCRAFTHKQTDYYPTDLYMDYIAIGRWK